MQSTALDKCGSQKRRPRRGANRNGGSQRTNVVKENGDMGGEIMQKKLNRSAWDETRVMKRDLVTIDNMRKEG